jgi:hypothetical protein
MFGKLNLRFARFSILLIVVTLIAAMAGCDGNRESYTLTITSTEGGEVTTPGEGTFSYNYSAVVQLIAVADVSDCYDFVNWTGDVDTIANIEYAGTSITMHGSYVITANFVQEISENLEIRDWYDLDAVRDNRCGNHTLMNDLDSTSPGYTELAGPAANDGKGWQPIGTLGVPFDSFTGSLNGQDYEIRDLFINRPDEQYIGLFGVVDDVGRIEDIGVVNANVTAYQVVGGLAGENSGTVSSSYYSGRVTGEAGVGGLVGENTGIVNDSHSSGNVTGEHQGGGLVGMNFEAVSNSYSTSSVTADSAAGGLAGGNEGTVSDSYFTGDVNGGRRVGGLVGDNWDGTVVNSYSTGAVTGHEDIGGLVGFNHGTVSDSYSIGSVSGDVNVGGLVGFSDGTVSDSFWDIETSGQADSDGGTGKNTTEMKDIITFSSAGWDIIAVALNETNPAYIWNIVNNITYPFLSWQPI